MGQRLVRDKIGGERRRKKVGRENNECHCVLTPSLSFSENNSLFVASWFLLLIQTNLLLPTNNMLSKTLVFSTAAVAAVQQAQFPTFAKVVVIPEERTCAGFFSWSGFPFSLNQGQRFQQFPQQQAVSMSCPPLYFPEGTLTRKAFISLRFLKLPIVPPLFLSLLLNDGSSNNM